VRPTVSAARRRGSAGGAVWEANKPAGLTLLKETTFAVPLTGTTANADGFAIANNEPARVTWSNTTDSNAPFGQEVLEWTYTAGDLVGGDVLLYMLGNPTVVKAYCCISHQFSPNYSWHSNGEKFWYPTITTPVEGGNSTSIGVRFTSSATDPDGANNRFSFNSQIGGGDSLFYPGNTSGYLVKGQYQTIEMFIQMNTPGNADGIWRAWVDGVLVADATALRYTNYPGAAQSVFSGALRFNGVRGGGDSSAPVPAGGMSRRFSRLSVYGSETF